MFQKPFRFDFILTLLLGFCLLVQLPYETILDTHESSSLILRNFSAILSVLACFCLLTFSLATIFINDYVKIRNVFLCVFLCIVLVLPIFRKMQIRFSHPEIALKVAHDGGVHQTEESARMVLRLENPYAEKFNHTALINVGVPGILVHNPYLPLSFLLPLPIIAITDILGLVYDQRLLYLALFAVTLLVLNRMTKTCREQSGWAVTVAALNPLLIPFLSHGMNEIYLVCFMTLIVWSAVENRTILYCILIALACAIKQFAWLAAPFLIVYAWRAMPRREVKRGILIGCTVWASIMLPFLVTNPGAMIDDTILFNAGRSLANYPLGGTPGLGFTVLPAKLRFVTDLNAYFPCLPFILVFGVPVLIAGIYRLWKFPRLDQALLLASCFSFVVFFFSRLFHTNYLGYLFHLSLLSVVAGCIQDCETSSPESS